MVSIIEGAEGGSVNTPQVSKEPAELALGVRSSSMVHSLKYSQL